MSGISFGDLFENTADVAVPAIRRPNEDYPSLNTPMPVVKEEEIDYYYEPLSPDCILDVIFKKPPVVVILEDNNDRTKKSSPPPPSPEKIRPVIEPKSKKMLPPPPPSPEKIRPVIEPKSKKMLPPPPPLLFDKKKLKSAVLTATAETKKSKLPYPEKKKLSSVVLVKPEKKKRKIPSDIATEPSVVKKEKTLFETVLTSADKYYRRKEKVMTKKIFPTPPPTSTTNNWNNYKIPKKTSYFSDSDVVILHPDPEDFKYVFNELKYADVKDYKKYFFFNRIF